MDIFDRIIGYEQEKKILKKISYCLNHVDELKAFGVKPPHGLLLFGRPGVGKTLMAETLIASLDRSSFRINYVSGSEKFSEELNRIFEQAKKEAPSLIFFDDIDKYASGFFPEDDIDSEEFSILQNLINECKDLDIFMLATVNHIDKLPKSLYRNGRFDEKLCIHEPTGVDAERIADHYISQYSTIEPNFDKKGFFDIIHGASCADIETIVNNAAVYAVCAERKTIQSDDLFRSALSSLHSIKDICQDNEDDLRKTAYHEAGHVVVSEIFYPHSIAAVSIMGDGRTFNGKTIHIGEFSPKSVEDVEKVVMTALGGTLGTEIALGEDDLGIYDDLSSAHYFIEKEIIGTGKYGLGQIGNDTTSERRRCDEIIGEAIIHRLRDKARLLLVKNIDFLHAIAEELLQKKYLVSTDIKRIHEAKKAM